MQIYACQMSLMKRSCLVKINSKKLSDHIGHSTTIQFWTLIKSHWISPRRGLQPLLCPRQSDPDLIHCLTAILLVQYPSKQLLLWIKELTGFKTAWNIWNTCFTGSWTYFWSTPGASSKVCGAFVTTLLTIMTMEKTYDSGVANEADIFWGRDSKYHHDHLDHRPNLRCLLNLPKKRHWSTRKAPIGPSNDLWQRHPWAKPASVCLLQMIPFGVCLLFVLFISLKQALKCLFCGGKRTHMCEHCFLGAQSRTFKQILTSRRHVMH